MPLVIKSEEREQLTPHLALCHEAQGFSANNRSVSLLVKSGEITEEVEKALIALGVKEQTEVVKAAFMNQVRNALQNAVKEKFGEDDSWIYVEDFNDTVVVFSNEKGLFFVNYVLEGDNAVIDDLATPATSTIVYVPKEGKMLLSEDAEDKLEEGVYTLMKSCIESPTTLEHLVKMFEHKQNEEMILQEEIVKAVAAAEAVLKAQLVEKEEQLTKALAQIEAFEKAQVEAVAKARKEAIAAVEKDAEQAEVLFKSLEAVSDEAFEAVIKSLKAKQEMLDNSELFIEKGANSEEAADRQEQKIDTMAVLKAKYAAKQ